MFRKQGFLVECAETIKNPAYSEAANLANLANLNGANAVIKV